MIEELDHGAPGDVAGRAIAPPGQHIRLEGLPHLLRALALTLDVSRQPFVIELADGAGLVSLEALLGFVDPHRTLPFRRWQNTRAQHLWPGESQSL